MFRNRSCCWWLFKFCSETQLAIRWSEIAVRQLDVGVQSSGLSSCNQWEHLVLFRTLYLGGHFSFHFVIKMIWNDAAHWAVLLCYHGTQYHLYFQKKLLLVRKVYPQCLVKESFYQLPKVKQKTYLLLFFISTMLLCPFFISNLASAKWFSDKRAEVEIMVCRN